MVKMKKKKKNAVFKLSGEKHIKNAFSLDVILVLKQVFLSWNINSFDFNYKTNQKPISVLGFYCLKIYNFIEHFSIAEEKITNFFEKLENCYKPNPYHNAVHGADILFSSLYIINNSLIGNNLADIEAFSMIIANLAHDVGHPGFTNRFLINLRDQLAIQCIFYSDNDNSVLENMHCATTFTILQESNSNILETFEIEQYLLIRKWIIELILATDMSKHFEFVGTFRAKCYTASEIEKIEVRSDTLKMIIKAADIGHSAKSRELHET